MQALNHEQPERIPLTLYVCASLRDKLTARWGPRDAWPCPPDDLIRILWQVETDDISAAGFTDPFGCRWKRAHGG